MMTFTESNMNIILITFIVLISIIFYTFIAVGTYRFYSKRYYRFCKEYNWYSSPDDEFNNFTKAFFWPICLPIHAFVFVMENYIGVAVQFLFFNIIGNGIEKFFTTIIRVSNSIFDKINL